MSEQTAGAGPSRLKTFVTAWTTGWDWRRLILVALVLMLVYQVVVPFGMIAWTSFKTARPGDASFLDLDFTLANYVRAFGTPRFWSATWSTLAFSTASTFVAFTIGAFLAWVIERTNTPLARLVGILLVGRIIIPGILITISWILIASPNIGLLNHLGLWLTGVRNIFNVYSFWGMVWVHSIEMVPLTYLLLAAAFQAMDPSLEEASTMTGAGVWRTLRRISMPLALPAAGAAVLLLFITTIETFEVPLLMGGRAGIRVYATEIFFNTSRTPTDWGISATYAMAMTVMSIILLVVYFRLIRHSERYQTITGKGYRPRRIDLGRWRYVTSALSLLMVFIITGVPFLMMLYVSFLPVYLPPSMRAFQSMSLVNYTAMLEDPAEALIPMWNSTLLGLGTATVVVLVVSAIAYFVHKTKIPGRKALDFLAFSSIALPSVVLGAAFLWFYLLVPIPVIGTLTIIGLAYLTKYMPFALRFVSSSMVQIHSELEEAAQVAGVPWRKNFFRIFLPLLKPGLLAAWFWVMVHAYRELTVALMLARSQNRTASVVIYYLWENGSFMQLSAFGVLIFILLIALVTASHFISKRYGVKEQY
ncbi:MAG TPA: iron ABC transporter permease [Alphaproteobacteria bacterium]|jgi:iron(III) transport system permease protein